MIKRIFKSWPSRVLAILVLSVLIIFVKEKLDNRVYITEVPETELPLALNGDLVLARTGPTYLVHDARDGTTKPLPQPDMPSLTYEDEPTCAFGDQIVLRRTIVEGNTTSPTDIYDWFLWSESGLIPIATHESRTKYAAAVNPWSCEVLPEGASFSYRFEDGRDGPDRAVVLTGQKGYGSAELPDHLDARFPVVSIATGSERFLIHEEESTRLGRSGARIGGRDELWIVADNETGTARQIAVSKARWVSSPMHDTDTLRCMSCGCECYRDYDYTLSGNLIFAVLTGELMFVRDAGIHRLDLRAPAKGWVHVLPAALNRPVIFSPDGCRAAISDGKVRIVGLCD